MSKIINASTHTKYGSLSNQKCEIEPNVLKVVILLMTYLM